MRLSTLLFGAATASAAVLENRQLGVRFAGSQVLTPELGKPGSLRKLARFGPINVRGKAPGKEDSGQQNSMLTIRGDLCKDCTILKGRVGLAFKDGSTANVAKGVYIHHVVSTDMTKTSKPFVNSCSGRSAGFGALGSKFMGTGDDQANIPVWYTSPDGKHNGGYHLGAADTIVMNIDLVNANTQAKEVYLTVDYEYLPGKVGSDTRDVLLSATGCGEPSIKISTSGPTNTTSGKYTFVEDGTIVFAKGHLHAGGEKMVMEINGKVACVSNARYGNAAAPAHEHSGKGMIKRAEGVAEDVNAEAGVPDAKESIVEMGYCTSLSVKKGDQMRMIAVYDASKHPVRHESGGMMGGMPDVMGMWAIAFGAT